MRRSILTLFFLFICLGIAGQSLAASYAIAPFKVNGGTGYAYLEKAIPPMFNSRLFLAGVNEPIAEQDKILSQKPFTDKQQAENTRKKYKADFLVYGSVTLLGENASIDVSVIGKDTFWQKAVQTNLNDLFDGVQSISDSINREIFNRNIASPTQNTNRTPNNQSIIANETTAQPRDYLNPDLRYQAETQRIRTAPLDFESYGFEIADFNNDGRNEIAILSSSKINVYKFDDNQLTQISSYRIPSPYEPLRLRSLVYNKKTYLVFSAHEKSTKSARSTILLLDGAKLKKITDINYYLNVASVAALDGPSLIGQRADSTRFVRGPVYQMKFNGTSIKQGRQLSLPKKTNVFNFAWLPGSNNDGGDHLLVINDSDKMITYDAKGKRLAQSEDIYASTGVGVRVTRDITGFASKEGSLDVLYYYVPMRIVISDLDKDGQYEAITSKPVSAAAILLNNYRDYSQGEIHSQIWDGIGMDLLWKTRKIKGTIVDVAVADPNNDGVMDLVVNVNTYPGTFGMGDIRTLILIYPLQTDNLATSAVNFNK